VHISGLVLHRHHRQTHLTLSTVHRSGGTFSSTGYRLSETFMADVAGLYSETAFRRRGVDGTKSLRKSSFPTTTLNVWRVLSRLSDRSTRRVELKAAHVFERKKPPKFLVPMPLRGPLWSYSKALSQPEFLVLGSSDVG
jgi:hypothetical protein